MRYQYVATGVYGCIGTFTTPENKKHYVKMPTPKMRATPTAKIEGQLRFVVESDAGGYKRFATLSSEPTTFGYSGIYTYCAIDDDGSALGEHGWVDTNSNPAKLILDANL